MSRILIPLCFHVCLCLSKLIKLFASGLCISLDVTYTLIRKEEAETERWVRRVSRFKENGD